MQDKPRLSVRLAVALIAFIIGITSTLLFNYFWPSARAPPQSMRAVSTEMFPRRRFVESPTLREQMPSVRRPSSLPRPGIHSRFVRASPARSIGCASGMPWAVP